MTDARAEILRRCAAGDRFAALHGDGDIAGGVTLHVLLAKPGCLDVVDWLLPPGLARYPTITTEVPAAFWYERKLHDLFGLVPEGHPRLDPLVLPQGTTDAVWPSPGAATHPRHVEPDERALPRHVMGAGLFSIPHGPVRSGVFESIEYVVETPGEDIPHVNVRPFAKHRGIEVRFEDLTVQDGVRLAERVEGVATVAHALAFSHAVETLTGTQPPLLAQLVRVLYAELERIANHLDVALRLADAAGLAVAVARFGWHKERVLRLVSSLCGSRFARSVIVPGGIRLLPALAPTVVATQLARMSRDLHADVELLMGTASFLDRLRGTGPLDPAFAVEHGLLGPVARASGYHDDARWERPYGAYPKLSPVPGRHREEGDALSRLWVRWDEVGASLQLLQQVLELAADAGDEASRAPVEPVAGQAVGWAEAPQGEVLYLLRTDASGRILRCAPRSASFHNLAAFSHAFAGDILTDFPFIEGSLGVSVAGVVL